MVTPNRGCHRAAQARLRWTAGFDVIGGEMKIWFMYDNHSFSKVPDIATAPRNLVEAHIRALFVENGSGTVFARNSKNEEIAYLHGHPFGEVGKSPWGVYPVEIESFLDKVEEHLNWDARG